MSQRCATVHRSHASASPQSCICRRLCLSTNGEGGEKPVLAEPIIAGQLCVQPAGSSEELQFEKNSTLETSHRPFCESQLGVCSCHPNCFKSLWTRMQTCLEVEVPWWYQGLTLPLLIYWGQLEYLSQNNTPPCFPHTGLCVLWEQKHGGLAGSFRKDSLNTATPLQTSPLHIPLHPSYTPLLPKADLLLMGNPHRTAWNVQWDEEGRRAEEKQEDKGLSGRNCFPELYRKWHLVRFSEQTWVIDLGYTLKMLRNFSPSQTLLMLSSQLYYFPLTTFTLEFTVGTNIVLERVNGKPWSERHVAEHPGTIPLIWDNS